MMKRRYFLLVLTVAVVVGMLVWGGGREREPEYGGKKLSEWVETVRGYTIGLPLIGVPSVIGPAADAIRETGTNAIPYLLEWISYEPPAWKSKSLALMNRIFHSRLVDHQALRADGAVVAFVILDGQAKGAIPRLILLANADGAPRAANRAVAALQIANPMFPMELPPVGR